MYRTVDRKNNLHAIASWLFRTGYFTKDAGSDWNIPNGKYTEKDGYIL